MGYRWTALMEITRSLEELCREKVFHTSEIYLTPQHIGEMNRLAAEMTDYLLM